MKKGIIIQARLGSTRMPGKVMKKICGIPVLGHVIDRMQRVDNADEVIVATSTQELDLPICDYVTGLNIPCYRGSEENVLSRYYEAAKLHNLDVIVRITSDCPLIDPEVTSNIIEYYLSNECDMATNGGPIKENRTFPRGMDVSVFSIDVLEEALQNATTQREKEHVTPYMYDNKNVIYSKNEVDYSHIRLTLDTVDDFILINNIYEALYPTNKYFGLNEIIDYLKKNENMLEINRDVQQKEV